MSETSKRVPALQAAEARRKHQLRWKLMGMIGQLELARTVLMNVGKVLDEHNKVHHWQKAKEAEQIILEFRGDLKDLMKEKGLLK